MAAFFPFSSAHLQFSFAFRDAVTLSQIEIFPVWKMFSFARKSLDLFANEEGLKRLAVISLFESKGGFLFVVAKKHLLKVCFVFAGLSF